MLPENSKGQLNEYTVRDGHINYENSSRTHTSEDNLTRNPI